MSFDGENNRRIIAFLEAVFIRHFSVISVKIIIPGHTPHRLISGLPVG
jgi:UDP-2,3-diacylglucosamine pyrophosphatase LpxH